VVLTIVNAVANNLKSDDRPFGDSPKKGKKAMEAAFSAFPIRQS
jgi:hypothetical protein